MANLKPLKDCVKLLSDVVIDSIKASGELNPGLKVADFGNVFGDIMVLLPEIADISFMNLAEADYAELVACVASDLILPGKAGAIVEACLKTLNDIVSVLVPDVAAIVITAQS